jgi:hypothetical protein
MACCLSRSLVVHVSLTFLYVTFIAAVFTPPKQNQAFLQGGTFVFDNAKTIFAHYDPSTAAHASVDRVMELAMVRLEKQAVAEES